MVVPLERRKTGPKAEKLTAIVDAMKADLKAKRLTIGQLRTMEDKALLSAYGDKFGSARTTCRKARDLVLTEVDAI
jgi:hypothetical protein